MDHELDLVIIGGGQAGLAAGYYAEQHSLNYVILDAAPAIGDSWRNRYDSLKVFTPRAYDNLPGLAMEGDRDGYPGKDEVTDYLKKYASHFQLRIKLGQEVTSLTKDSEKFIISTKIDSYTAYAVIVATGPFQKPHIPEWAIATAGLKQMHSSQYHNPKQVDGHKVLIVGGGNSGAQITEELADNGFEVTLSTNSPLRFLPTKILGRSVFWWLSKTGLLQAPKGSIRARLSYNYNDPIVGTRLQSLIKSGRVILRPGATAMAGRLVSFGEDGSDTFDTIIWATGYTSDYSFIDIPGALDLNGQPIHRLGVSTEVDHLGYLGLAWLRSRSSALIGGVGADAREVVEAVTGLNDQRQD